MKLTVYQFEGTADEIARIHRDIAIKGGDLSLIARESPARDVTAAKGAAETDVFVSTKVARLALTRRPLSSPQRQLLLALYTAHQRWQLASDLQTKIGYSPSQFAGLMGAFGRRVAFTAGYSVGSCFFEQEWDDLAACNKYRLPEPVREAMRMSRLV